jgi:hypothetical protein
VELAAVEYVPHGRSIYHDTLIEIETCMWKLAVGIFFIEAIPMCLETIKIIVTSVKHNLFIH